MSRIKRGIITKKRHKRVLKRAKGFYAQRSKIFRRAQETILRAMEFAFKSRKFRKRDFRALFITRINAACSAFGVPYNLFMNGLKKSNIQLNRKMLSQLAIFEPKAFEKLVEISKK
jgi:large subunit ribosomal protein L20